MKPRYFPPPELPSHPYPLLLPIAHPDFMAGRDDDLVDLRRVLARPGIIVGLHAASGTGKSSLLAGGLVPTLRAEGRPVAFERHPAEPGLMARLIGDLVEDGEQVAADGQNFVDLLASLQSQTGSMPVLVVDQFEDVLKEGAESTRAVLGKTLAASARRLPGSDSPPCRWLLAYRQEYHGKLVAWLKDVLRDTRTSEDRASEDRALKDIKSLPHDLSGAGRFTSWPLRPLATPPADAEDLADAASRVFLDAIEKPLARGAFPWTFAPGHAARLARAFAEARLRRLDAPLVPEFQVVLARLLGEAGEPSVTPGPVVKVPDKPDGLIRRALEEHLRRSLDFAFPLGGAIARARALLVLRELADMHGRREEGRAADTLARTLGEQGREVLEKLSTPRARIVLLERLGGAMSPWGYVLSHDRLAEVLVRVVDEGGWAGLFSSSGDVDAGLLGLRRFVVLQSQLFATGDVEQATTVPPGHFDKIEANREVLLWSDTHHVWWNGCRQRRRLEQRRKWLRRTAVSAAVVLAALVAWILADRRARHLALLEEVATGEPEVAFAALDRLARREGYSPDELLDLLRKRKSPYDIFERGLGGVAEARRAEALVRLAPLALPILEASPEDPVLIASLVWALDFFAAPFEDRAAELRQAALAPLRRRRPPPPLPAADDPHWAHIAAGTFWMGADPDEERTHERMRYEFPRHQVSLSAFRIMTHEVTVAEYRRLVPEHPRPERPDADDLPVGNVSWYDSYTYAAWLGGRLPTEAEWEYAARAGCAHTYCRRDGSEATLDDVAWWVGNSVDPATGEPVLWPVARREPNPWGLWDLYGNVWDRVADWHGVYPRQHVTNPAGPSQSPTLHRVVRGGSMGYAKEWLTASSRLSSFPDFEYEAIGLRVMIPE